jgi:hypothetical protein
MTKRGWILAAAVALFLATPAFPCDMHRMGAGGENCFFSDGESFDLSELADGETRYFGPREREVAVTRTGDEVVMTLSGDDGETHEIKCNVVEDGCFIFTGDENEDASIRIMRTRGPHGHGREDFLFVGDESLSDGRRVLIEALSAVDNKFVFGDQRMQWVSDDEDAGGHQQLFRMLAEPGTLVRCPEGDTTMRLEEDESAEGYYCPRHNVMMETVEHSFGRFDVKLDVHEDHE